MGEANLRKCSACRVPKPSDDFSPRGNGKRQAYCRPCFAAKCRIYRKRNPGYRAAVDRWRLRNPEAVKQLRRKGHYRERYGITIPELQKMVATQEGLCANPGCRCVLVLHGRGDNSAALDHSHKSKKNRGVLCKKCNIGLGHFADDATKIAGILEYLRKYQED